MLRPASDCDLCPIRHVVSRVSNTGDDAEGTKSTGDCLPLHKRTLSYLRLVNWHNLLQNLSMPFQTVLCM